MWTCLCIWGSECGFCYCFVLFEGLNSATACSSNLDPGAVLLFVIYSLHRCPLLTCTTTLPYSSCHHFPQGVHLDFLVSPMLQRQSG